ncbi:hypothetical protein LSH36_684g01000 [Paralvinella palmiformis]|uniref:Protein LMBR1L n=1 Tax=Paralvinella palmiformis TaxID=53620 RepID=A0AAD9J2K2_9ANNE|nr:hypothetical protein LSH36_684g01000 [Paralvinella palmiformis]
MHNPTLTTMNTNSSLSFDSPTVNVDSYNKAPWVLWQKLYSRNIREIQNILEHPHGNELRTDQIMDDDVYMREKIFYNAVRECIILLLLFALLYITSYFTICTYKRRPDSEDYYSDNREDALVYRVSVWLCTFTLAVSGGAVLLLPISIVANEALLMFPNSYYLQWVNSSLIHGLWNQVFLFSNLALFVLMPFAYFFTESEGLPGSGRGIKPRVYETFLVLFLVSIIVCGLVWIVSSIFDAEGSSQQTLFDIWNFYLPYLYSCMSLLGVVMLLICTPVGFARLFTVIGELVKKPKFLLDLDDQFYAIVFEEETLKRKLCHNSAHLQPIANGHSNVSTIKGIMVLMVVQNTLELLIGLKALPVGTKEIVLGLSSLTALGPIGAAVEIVIILYLMLASVVGFYSLPFLQHLQPKCHDTPMPKVIGNCMVIVVLSSALPVLSRTLGITNFDLLGNFGRLEWLGNFYIILSYNLVFAIVTALCLATKFTATLRRELLDRLRQAFTRNKHPMNSAISGTTSTVNATTQHSKDD